MNRTRIARHAGLASIAFATIALLVFQVSFGVSADEPTTVSPLGYIEMPLATDGSYTLSAAPGKGRHWGRPEMIRYLMYVASEWARRHPDKPRLHYGDLSKADGSDFPPHKTHKDGLTADVFTRPKNICHIKYEDQKLTAELAELMVQLGARQLLYNGKEVQALVPMAQTVPKHDDHFHVVIDPNKVPKDLAPILLAETQSKTGGVLGEASFGKPRRSPKKKKKKRGKKGEAPATDPDPLPDARVAWRFLGDAKGFQKTVVVEAESKAAGLAYRSEPTKGPKTWHLIPGELADGQTLRWRVTVQCSDDTEQNIPWQELRVDLRPPVVAGVAPAPGSTSARRPKFTWTYKDPSAQLRAHVEIKHRKAKRGAAAAQLEGSAAELAAPVDLPKGDLSWRVVATDLAGNQAASDWVDFTVE